MDKSITAKWACETAKKVLSDKVQGEISRCEILIKKGVAENKMSATIHTKIHQLTRDELTSRGFQLSEHTAVNQRDSDSLTIKW